MDIALFIELVLFAVLMLLSGFFSSSETSLFSLNDLQLEQMRRDDNPRIALIERMLSEPGRLIVTILIGNEFVNVATSVISAAIGIQLLRAENKLVNLFIMVPILMVFSFLARMFGRLFGGKSGGKNPFTLREEIQTMMQMSANEGDIRQTEQDMIRRLFNFGEATAHEVMMPLIDLVMVERSATFAEAKSAATRVWPAFFWRRRARFRQKAAA